MRTRNTITIVLAIAMIFALTAAANAATPYTWDADGGVGNVTWDYDSGGGVYANWAGDPPALPGASDSVTFTNILGTAYPYVVDMNGLAITVQDMYISGASDSFDIQDIVGTGSLAVTNLNHDSGAAAGNTISGALTMGAGGAIKVSAGTLNISNAATNTDNASLNVSGGHINLTGVTAPNFAYLADLTESGTITSNTDVTVTSVGGDGYFDLTADKTFTYNGGGSTLHAAATDTTLPSAAAVTIAVDAGSTYHAAVLSAQDNSTLNVGGDGAQLYNTMGIYSGSNSTTTLNFTGTGGTAALTANTFNDYGGATTDMVVDIKQTGGSGTFVLDTTASGSVVAADTTFKAGAGTTFEAKGASPLGASSTVNLDGGTARFSLGGVNAAPTAPVAGGLVIQWDANSLNGAVADGAQVNSWENSANSGTYDLTRMGGSPKYDEVVPELNDQSAVVFSAGGSDWFEFDDINTIRSVFWVLRNTGPANEQFLLGDDGSYDFHSGAGNLRLLHDNYAHANLKNGSTELNGTVVDPVNTDRPSDFAIVSMIATGNVEASRVSYDRTYGNRSWEGEIAEILIYNTALSGADEDKVGAYLASKYGLTTSYVIAPTAAVAGDLNMTGTDFIVTANSTLQAYTAPDPGVDDGDANFGGLTLNSGILTIEGVAGETTFTGTTVDAGVSAGVTSANALTLGALNIGNGATFQIGSPSNTSLMTVDTVATVEATGVFNVTAYDDGAAATLNKTGSGTMNMPTTGAENTTFHAAAGTLAFSDGTVGGSTADLNLEGGTIKITAETVLGYIPLTWDFEGDLNGWTVIPTGAAGDDDNAFADGRNPNGREDRLQHGDYHISTRNLSNPNNDWDNHEGILESPWFIVGDQGGGEEVSFLAGGGNDMIYTGDPDVIQDDVATVTLERQVAPGDWELIHSSDGNSNWNLFNTTLDVSSYVGDTMRFRIYDTREGGWGFVEADYFQVGSGGG